MDTVYGTKKYFQSLSGASDIYRTPACRAVSNDYTYQNTLGRRSTLGAYYHMSNQPSYSNDHSVNNQYGYNTWGIWRDGRNVAPSTFSAKPYPQYQKTRSFSIILTTAAFIVLLAVISIAGLAFYFSSIKGNMEDPVLGFEGSFRIAKGDMFSTGLKYNHTSSYKQKIEFYKRFVERALSDQGLQPMKTDVWGFGEGPLIKVNFRTFFDVRKLPQNIHNVEEYIKEAIFLETTSVKSLYRSLRIDADSVEIKRILDEQVVKSASLFKETPSAPTSQTQLEKRLMKKGGSPPALINKPSSAAGSSKGRTTAKPHSSDDEPDIDVENAPVIQGSFEGSFEITKTDADIARKRTTPTRAYAHSSLPPKSVTPFALRVKPKKPGIEKLTTILPQTQSQPSTTTKLITSSSSTTISAPTTTTTATTTTTTTTTTPKPTTTTTPTSTTTSTKAPPRTTTTTTTSSTTSTTTTTTTPKPTTAAATTTSSQPSTRVNHYTYPSHTTSTSPHLLPKLDQNLFTSVPVLDTQPWRPIHREVPEFLPGPPPSFPTKTLPTVQMPVHSTSLPQIAINEEPPRRRTDEIELPFLPEEPRPPKPILDPYTPNFFGPAMRKPDFNVDAKNPQDMVFYHSFGNPVFMPGSEGIERLGAGVSVQPHPLPVPLIDDVVIPPFKPLHPGLGANDKLSFDIAAQSDKFEHLGDGVIAKKPESTTIVTDKEVVGTMPTSSTTAEKPKENDVLVPTTKPMDDGLVDTSSVTSELADKIGEFFMDLLDLPKDDVNNKQEQPLQSRIEQEEESFTLPAKQSEEEANTVKAISSTQEQTTENIKPTTIKPNFMNLKELILKRNQQLNQNQKKSSSQSVTTQHSVTSPVTTTPTTTTVEYTTTTPTSPTTTTTTPMPITTTTRKQFTTQATTTKRYRIRPSNSKPPTIIDDSNLFPSHSKWEFVNSSNANNFGHTGNMRKVFNTTLQAWVSEDVEKTDNFTLDDIKTKINNATNIQDISLIFDTLASKLGITPSVPTKVPPFSHKLKLPQNTESRGKPSPTTTTRTTTVARPTTVTPTKSTTVFPVTSPKSPTTTAATTAEVRSTSEEQFVIERREPFIKPMSSFIEDSSSEGVGAAIPVVGEAEVEVIDPTRYEEMLMSSQFADPTTTETTPKLVTLLPVRSNSGIRTYKPLAETGRSSVSTTTSTNSFAASLSPGRNKSPSSRPGITRRKTVNQSRRFPPAEAVIRGGLRVTVK